MLWLAHDSALASTTPWFSFLIYYSLLKSSSMRDTFTTFSILQTGIFTLILSFTAGLFRNWGLDCQLCKHISRLHGYHGNGRDSSWSGYRMNVSRSSIQYWDLESRVLLISSLVGVQFRLGFRKIQNPKLCIIREQNPASYIKLTFSATFHAQKFPFDSIFQPTLTNSESGLGLQNRPFWDLSPLSCHLKNATAAFPIFPPYLW
jgi:hypothetical protein